MFVSPESLQGAPCQKSIYMHIGCARPYRQVHGSDWLRTAFTHAQVLVKRQAALLSKQ